MIKYRWSKNSIPIRELYTNFDFSKIGMPLEKLRTFKKGTNKEKICSNIFKDFFKLMFDDVINNDDIFKLPLPYSEGYIQTELLRGEDFKKARQNGVFQDIDFLKSNFTGVQVIFRYKQKGFFKRKKIYVSDKIKKILRENLYNNVYK